MRLRPPGLAALALLAAGAACRSTAPRTRPVGPAPTSPAAVYVGQQRILVQHGDERRVALSRKDLSRLKSGCDAAVEIKDAALDKGTLRLRLAHLGRVKVEGKPAGKTECGQADREITVAVAGFEGAVGADELEADVVRVLATPEAYLGGRGVVLEAAPDDPKAPLASIEPTASPAERALWSQLTSQPKLALRVDPDYHATGRKVHHEGEVEFQAVVGTDGRLRDPRLKGSLSPEHEAHVLRALGLWRYQPARRKDAAVPARVSGRLVFRIY
jgi:hypothetical protein